MQKDAEGENINIAGVEGKFVFNGKEGEIWVSYQYGDRPLNKVEIFDVAIDQHCGFAFIICGSGSSHKN
jgi:hypothetical protein